MNGHANAAFDLSRCIREPIHVPGAIQPHGAVLGVLADTLLVSHASANLATILGLSVESILGRPLWAAIGEAACDSLHLAALSEGITSDRIVSLTAPDGDTLGLRAHRTGRYICVDIEPILSVAEQRPTVIMAQSVLETFKQAATRRELCELAVRGLKAVIGYDRVMAYRFHEDGHGEVIAEARSAGLEPYLGLHYPASDVPHQARQLYVRQRVGAIADADYEPAPLLADPALDDGTAFDLTFSALRSVARVHREYMRNMKTVASLRVGLTLQKGGAKEDLWGLLVCHHGTPRIADPELRAAANMIGQVVSLLLGSYGEAEEYAQRLERNATLNALRGRLSNALPLLDALATAEAELLDVMRSTGVAVRMGGTTLCLGRTPPRPSVEQILALMRPGMDDAVVARDDLGLRHPEFGGLTREASGALLLPLSGDDAILWFRPEFARTVAWGGNPDEYATSDPVTGRLSPRRSFAAWQQTVSGRSVSWSEADLATARHIREMIGSAIAQRTKADLARLRHYDSLTGLPNRSLLLDRLRDAAHAEGGRTALLFLDLDRFKAVNDTMGHTAGDALLVEVARRLRAAAGPDNMAARLGGDEFVVLCPKLNRDAVIAVGEQIRRSVEVPFDIGGRPCHISASIGLAVSDHSGGLDLVRAADMAMYAAKQHGGNRLEVFERSLFDRAARQFEMELDMREALRTGDQFVMWYQPIYKVTSGIRRLVGFEALLRWRHPRHGWMAPGQFIPVAEKSGLILPLGDWILATSLRQGRVLRRAYPDADLTLAVNLSVLQLPRTGFCADLAALLQAEAFPAPALCLEVTESIVSDAAATAVLADVRALGVRVAIDDFGIGYSSLSYLRRLPVDVVKLDRSFLEDIENDTGGKAFVGAVIALAHAAGKPVIFEGIETKAQFDIATDAGADMVQGFLFAPPLSASATEALVVQYREVDALRRLSSETATAQSEIGA
jgi:diguanylate cyclase (GGDEF)-like protein